MDTATKITTSHQRAGIMLMLWSVAMTMIHQELMTDVSTH